MALQVYTSSWFIPYFNQGKSSASQSKYVSRQSSASEPPVNIQHGQTQCEIQPHVAGQLLCFYSHNISEHHRRCSKRIDTQSEPSANRTTSSSWTHMCTTLILCRVIWHQTLTSLQLSFLTQDMSHSVLQSHTMFTGDNCYLSQHVHCERPMLCDLPTVPSNSFDE